MVDRANSPVRSCCSQLVNSQYRSLVVSLALGLGPFGTRVVRGFADNSSVELDSRLSMKKWISAQIYRLLSLEKTLMRTIAGFCGVDNEAQVPVKPGTLRKQLVVWWEELGNADEFFRASGLRRWPTSQPPPFGYLHGRHAKSMKITQKERTRSVTRSPLWVFQRRFVKTHAQLPITNPLRPSIHLQSSITCVHYRRSRRVPLWIRVL